MATARLTFEELAVGETWESQGRTITETDIVQFACMTGDFDPLHVDHHRAEKTPYGRPVAHGLLGLSYLAGLSAHAPAVETSAFLRVEQWKFLRPIFIGETVYARTEVISAQPHGRRHGEVNWKRQLINAQGEVLQEGIFVTLVARAQPQLSVRGKSTKENLSDRSPRESENAKNELRVKAA